MSDADTVPAWLARRATDTPDQAAYWSRDDTSGNWRPIDWGSVQGRVRRLAFGLRSRGLQTGDRAVIALPTGIDWECCHQAVLATGGVVVGVDAHDTDTNIGHLLGIAEPTVLIAASQDLAERLRALCQTPPRLIVVASGAARLGTYHLADLEQRGSVSDEPLPHVAPDHLATIVFTSGSTGLPKGVPYTHAQLCFVAQAILERFPSIREGARLVCWLPLSNLFQRMLNLCGLICGAQSYFVDNPARIIDRLPEIRPAVFIGVPRFYEKLHAGILAELARRPWPLRLLASGAWAIGNQFHRIEREGRKPGPVLTLAHRLADGLVLARIRSLTGSDLQFMVSGSAPMPLWLLKRFHGLGWLVLEAYGTSENALPIALNTPHAFRFGSVGRPFEQNELCIADDEEVLVRGPAVFSGYYGEPSADSSLDADRFLHTGDLGRLDEDGFLWLTGRKSEIFKTSTGRRIPPAPIEACLKRIPYVEHALICGRDHPFAVAVLGLDASLLPTAPASDKPLPEGLLDRIGKDVRAACAHLPAYQQPAAALVTRHPFTIDGGQLTANLKLRRKAIEADFGESIERLYRSLDAGSGSGHSPYCKVVEIR